MIWPPLEVFYIHSMLFNSSSALRSIVRLERAFDAIPANPTNEEFEKLPAKLILDELQNMVLQAGALSRYFWPVGKKHAARGKQLRNCFSMTEENPLFSRKLRNAIEHFDERIDEYFSQGAVGYFFPEYVGPKPEDDGVPGHIFRAYFVDTGEFRLLGEDFHIPPVADEILFIQAHLEKMDREGGRFQTASRDA